MSQQNECKQWIMQEALNPESELLLNATLGYKEEACRLLVERFRWDVNLPTGDEPVYVAIRLNDIELARAFLLEWDIHVDSWTVLEIICRFWRNFEHWLRILVTKPSIDINAKHEEGYNACVTALGAWRPPVSKLQTLLRFGCNPNQSDHQSRTPLHCSAMKALHYSDGRRDIWPSPERFDRKVRLLLSQKDVHANRVCHKGWTDLHYLTDTFRDYFFF